MKTDHQFEGISRLPDHEGSAPACMTFESSGALAHYCKEILSNIWFS
jgi:hypothetical protein